MGADPERRTGQKGETTMERTQTAGAAAAVGYPDKKHMYGCPYCGVNTRGSPTDKSFQWAACEECHARYES